MKKIAYLLLLAVVTITTACGGKRSPQDAANDMYKAINEAAKDDDMESFNQIYVEYLEYLKSLSPDEQRQFLEITQNADFSDDMVHFITNHIEEIAHSPAVRDFDQFTSETLNVTADLPND